MRTCGLKTSSRVLPEAAAWRSVAQRGAAWRAQRAQQRRCGGRRRCVRRLRACVRCGGSPAPAYSVAATLAPSGETLPLCTSTQQLSTLLCPAQLVMRRRPNLPCVSLASYGCSLLSPH